MTILLDILRPIINMFFVFLMFFVARKKEITKKILIIKLEGLGDFIVFMPSLIRYKKVYPDYKVTLLVDNVINYNIAKRYDDDSIDDVILFDAKKFSKNIFYRFKMSKQLYISNFDITINPLYYRRKISDFIVKIAKSKERITFAGYEIEKGGKVDSSDVYTKLIHVPKEIFNEFYRHKYFIEQLNKTTYTDYSLTFPLQETDINNAKKVLSEYNINQDAFIALFPGAGRAVSKWEPEKFAKVIDYVTEHNFQVVICGSKMEKSIAQKIIMSVDEKKRSHVTDLTDKTDIFTTAGIIKLAKFYLGNDSGPTHTAEAIGQTIICPLGLGHFKEFYPSLDIPTNIIVSAKNMDCLNDLYACAKNLPPGSPAPCVSNITVEQILVEIKKLLK